MVHIFRCKDFLFSHVTKKKEKRNIEYTGVVIRDEGGRNPRMVARALKNEPCRCVFLEFLFHCPDGRHGDGNALQQEI